MTTVDAMMVNRSALIRRNATPLSLNITFPLQARGLFMHPQHPLVSPHPPCSVQRDTLGTLRSVLIRAPLLSCRLRHSASRAQILPPLQKARPHAPEEVTLQEARSQEARC